jgi:hypothetical protein
LDSTLFEARAGRFGFSRVELLAVLTTIRVLAGLLFLVINLAHVRVQMAYCKNNNGQLCRAWLRYAQANQSLINNFGRDEMRAEYLSGNFSNRVNGVLDWGTGEHRLISRGTRSPGKR